MGRKLLKGLKRFGHRSHVAAGRIMKSLSQGGYFENRVRRERKLYLSK